MGEWTMSSFDAFHFPSEVSGFHFYGRATKPLSRTFHHSKASVFAFSPPQTNDERKQPDLPHFAFLCWLLLKLSFKTFHSFFHLPSPLHTTVLKPHLPYQALHLPRFNPIPLHALHLGLWMESPGLGPRMLEIRQCHAAARFQAVKHGR